MESRIIIKNDSAVGNIPLWLYNTLPDTAKSSLGRVDTEKLKYLSEIRLRTNGICTLTCGGENIVLYNNTHYIVLAEKEIDNFLHKVCNGSVYSYENSIAQGFITVNGVRIGISGDVTLKNGVICGFSKIRSVNVRIPRHVDGCADKLLCHIKATPYSKLGGILVASAPGVGKTTVLRELALKLSSDKDWIYRVCVVDERCEIYMPELFKNSSADVFSGIPKNKGIEFASRVMSPQFIIFDEIGSDTDALSILSAHFGGSVFISSVHASTPDTILQKNQIKTMCDEGVFSHIFFLERTGSTVKTSLHKI